MFGSVLMWPCCPRRRWMHPFRQIQRLSRRRGKTGVPREMSRREHDLLGSWRSRQVPLARRDGSISSRPDTKIAFVRGFAFSTRSITHTKLKPKSNLPRVTLPLDSGGRWWSGQSTAAWNPPDVQLSSTPEPDRWLHNGSKD